MVERKCVERVIWQRLNNEIWWQGKMKRKKYGGKNTEMGLLLLGSSLLLVIFLSSFQPLYCLLLPSIFI
jgi:hypothetical protein